ncbi:MAG TPA: methionine--tRNA ligase, partial [bacterium]|nr:methionine--tRNA ligase [bacterium]
LKEIIEKNRIEIIPPERKREVLSVIKQGLEDICISRSVKRAHGWGIRTPGDNSQIVWVWFDALANYITALGYADEGPRFQKFWQENENKLHIIGKGISRFHCLYWPAILLSAGLSLPKTIFIHGYITVGKEKMSKSLGNVVSPFDLVEKYGTDPVRYFFLREIPPSEDGDFSIERFESRYNTDLANGLGNLTSRVIALSKKLKINPSLKKEFGSKEVRIEVERAYRNSFKALEHFSFNKSLEEIWSLINFSDRYIERERPWETKNKQVIGNLLFILSEIAMMLKVFLPETSKRTLKQIETGESKPLFPRI